VLFSVLKNFSILLPNLACGLAPNRKRSFGFLKKGRSANPI
jgi:hypothetical protein